MGNVRLIGVLFFSKKALLACGRVLENVDVAPIALTVTAVDGFGWIAVGPMEFTVSLNMPHLTKVFQPTRRSVRGLFFVTKAWMTFRELSMVTVKLVVPMMGILSPETL